MGKVGATVLAIIAVLLLLTAGGISLGSLLDTWAIPVLVLIWAIAKLMVNFKK